MEPGGVFVPVARLCRGLCARWDGGHPAPPWHKVSLPTQGASTRCWGRDAAWQEDEGGRCRGLPVSPSLSVPPPSLCPGGVRCILVNRASPLAWYPAWYPLLHTGGDDALWGYPAWYSLLPHTGADDALWGYPVWYPLLPHTGATGSPTPRRPPVRLSPQAPSLVPPARAVPPSP